jgi:hypothetical protein
LSIASNATTSKDPSISATIRREHVVALIWRRGHLGALFAHLALSLLFTWPLALNLLPGASDLVPGVMIEDRDQNLWNLWWVREAVLQGRNPFVTDMIWYPTGVTLYYHTLNVFNGLLAIPLLTFFTLTTTYNLIILFSFVMGGYGAFLLVHYLCGNRWAALVGSVVFAYSAYHIATMRNLLQLVSLEWVPFFVLFLLQAVFASPWHTWRGAGKWLLRRALPASVALFLVALVDWYYTLYSLIFALLLALYLLIRNIAGRRESTGERLWLWAIGTHWVRIGACLAIFLVLASPILIPTLRELRTTTYMLPAPDAALSNSADLLAFFQPPRDNKLLGGLSANRGEWPFAGNRYEVYLTYTALLLAAVALFVTRARRPNSSLPGAREPSSQLPSKWFWAACSLLFFLLALGPVLQINGQQVRWLFSPEFRLVMPYSLIEGLPVLNISRSPDRFDMPLTLCLGVLAGYGVNVLLSRWPARLASLAKGPVIALAAIALITVELFPMPYVQLPAPIPGWYHELGKEQGDFAILELPPQDDYWHGAYRMYYQTAHGKRIFGGYISREFPHPFLERTPGFQELTNLDGESDIFAVGPETWKSALARYNTRYIVLQKDRLPEKADPPIDVSPSREAIKRVLGSDATPVHEDEQLEVYRVPTPDDPEPFISLGEGWEPRETGPNGTFRWIGREASLEVHAPQAQEAVLTFKATSLGPPRRLQIFHGDHLVFDQEVGPLQTYRTQGPLGLPAGGSTLRLVSPGGMASPSELGVSGDERQLSFSFLDVQLESDLDGSSPR